MPPPPKRFAPPPVHWPGAPAAAQPGSVQPGAVQTKAAQPQAAFNAIRTARTERTVAKDELVRAQGDQFLLKTLDRGLHLKPDGTYNFVRVHGQTRNDTHTYVSPRSSHSGLAGGKPVIYAGTARFESGRLDWWSNYSGTYQPVAALNRQAELPGDRFVPWQKLQMGGIGLQRGMLGERRGSAPPERAPDKPTAKPAAKPEPAAGAKAPSAAPAAAAKASPAKPADSKPDPAKSASATPAAAPVKAGGR